MTTPPPRITVEHSPIGDLPLYSHEMQRRLRLARNGTLLHFAYCYPDEFHAQMQMRLAALDRDLGPIAKDS